MNENIEGARFEVVTLAALAQPQEAAHPSACELGAVRVTDEMVRAAQQREFNAPKNEPMGATVRGMLEPALQHRGDSRGGEGRP
jgi:hypothetical protein